jgi:hypothetical protein
MRLTCTINGEPREVDGVWEGESLLYVLRERLALPGSKNGCEQGECGSCSVYLDGELVCACLVLAGQAEGREIVTVEGLAPGEDDGLGQGRLGDGSSFGNFQLGHRSVLQRKTPARHQMAPDVAHITHHPPATPRPTAAAQRNLNRHDIAAVAPVLLNHRRLTSQGHGLANLERLRQWQ